MGLAFLAAPEFSIGEIASPQPDILSRALERLSCGRPLFASWNQVAEANSADGIDIVLPYCDWINDILNPVQRQEVQTLFVSSLVTALAGFRIRHILAETHSAHVTEFCRRSVEYQEIAEFPETGRVFHLMTLASATAIPGSVGNIIFQKREPMLYLRASDQQLLKVGLNGATDAELALNLGITAAAVKARWRSIFARFDKIMPAPPVSSSWPVARGMQKRHRILEFVRDRPEELRPSLPPRALSHIDRRF